MPRRCVSPYRGVFKHQAIAFKPGDVVDDPALEAYLDNDSPASFVAAGDEEPEAKAVDTAPADKMVKGPQIKKGARHGK